MLTAGEQTDRLEVLRGLVARLAAPDLTLDEGKVLRERMLGLLNPGDPDRGFCQPMPALMPATLWSADPTMRAAG